MTLDELIAAFMIGVLNESEGDMLILDKSRFELMADKKGFSFDESAALTLHTGRTGDINMFDVYKIAE